MAKTPIEQILDPNDTDPIVLYTEEDEAVTFEQVALIPLDGEMYVILKPIEMMEGVADDEALVFAIIEDDEEDVLEIVEDDDIVDAVFEEYTAMLAEEGII